MVTTRLGRSCSCFGWPCVSGAALRTLLGSDACHCCTSLTHGWWLWLVFVNHRKGLEYAGTVAAFTAPIIMIQDAESKQDKQTAALSRIEQTLVGVVAVVVVINIMWRTTSQSSHQVRHEAGCHCAAPPDAYAVAAAAAAEQVRRRLTDIVAKLEHAVDRAVATLTTRALKGGRENVCVVASRAIAEALHLPESAVDTGTLRAQTNALQQLVKDAAVEPSLSQNVFPYVAACRGGVARRGSAADDDGWWDATSTKRLLDAISVLQSMIVFTRALEETAVSVGVKRSHMYVLATRLHRHKTDSQQPVAHANADQHWGVQA